MKILFVLPHFNRQQWDSLTDQTWNMARLLTASGQVQCAIAAARSEDEAALEVVNQVPIHRFMPERRRWKFWGCTKYDDVEPGNVQLPGLEVFLRKNQFDLVHLLIRGKLCETAAGILRERRIPYIISCRSEDFCCSDALANSNRIEDRQNRLNRACRDYVHALEYAQRIFCSDHQLRRLLAVRFGDRQLVYWQPGVAWERYARPSTVDFRQFYKISPSRQIILSVGQLAESKNQKLLLEIVAVLNQRGWNCQLVVIGWNKFQSYLREFRNLTASRKLGDFLTFIPGLPPGDERFAAAFQAASLVVLPARYEVSAPAVLEAWAAGAPVLATAAGGGGELIEDQISGRIIDLQDFQACISHCEALLEERNRAQLEKMRSVGMAKARSLRWENRIADLLEIYKEVANN